MGKKSRYEQTSERTINPNSGSTIFFFHVVCRQFFKRKWKLTINSLRFLRIVHFFSSLLSHGVFLLPDFMRNCIKYLKKQVLMHFSDNFVFLRINPQKIKIISIEYSVIFIEINLFMSVDIECTDNYTTDQLLICFYQ